MPGQDFVKGRLTDSERRGHFSSIEAIKAFADFAANHFFEPAAMRGFASRVLDGVYHGINCTYFVTSERFVPSRGAPDPRKYTIRKVKVDLGDGRLGCFIDTVGSNGGLSFGEFKNARQARAAICRLTDEEEARDMTEEEAAIAARAEADIAEKRAASKKRNAAMEERRKAAAAAGVPW
jgi:hypothetical protein